MKNTRAVLRALPLVASALGSKYGVRVVIGGNQARTDGRTITLPSLPLDMPETFLLLVRGYLDHEAGHIRETDFDALRGARLSPLEHHVWNSIEDWRVERRMAEIFPGCRHNFNRLVRHVFAGSATVSGSPVQDIPNWLLLVIRSWDVPELAASRDELARHMDREFPGLRARLESVLHAVRALCRSTGDALDYARRIVRLLEQAAQPQPASCAPGKQKSPRDASTPGQKAGAGQAADQKEDGPAPVALPDSNPETDRHQAIAAGETRRKGSPAKAAKRLKALLDAPGDALPGNLGSVLAQAITEAAPGDGKDALRVAVVGHKPLLPLSEQERKDALRASTALQARLHGLLQASTLVRCATGRRGRLDTGRLHRLAVDDSRVFRRKGLRQGMDSAVHLLLDCSSSMDKGMELACAASYALARALEACAVNVGVSAFPAGAGENRSWATVAPLVRHGQRVHPHMAVRAYGRTPLAEALWWAMGAMLPLPQRRKLILVVTDGEPDSLPCARRALEAARQHGFEVLGVGIANSAVRALLPRRNIVIQDMRELCPALFQLLHRAMLGTDRAA